MTTDSPYPQLALTDDLMEPAIAAPWIGPLVALGGRASSYAKAMPESTQLVVVLSVPRRDFAATIIGCGWAMNSAAPELPDPLEVFRGLDPDTSVRVVTHMEVIADRFRAFDETKSPARVRLSGSHWLASSIHAVAVTHQEPPQSLRMPRPNPGSLARIARLIDSWDARLALPAADLAIVGTLKWLGEDMAGYVTRDGEEILPEILLDQVRTADARKRANEVAGLGRRLADLLLPAGPTSATWFTRLFASARLSEHLPLPGDIRATILDGAGAIKYVAEIESPIVICILDRSVADETAGELVVQLRNSRGEPISLHDDLHWHPPHGVEALAFTVAL